MTQDMPAFTVRAEWDPEARVWYVAESDVPGLVAEAETVEELAGMIDELVPELIELNAHLLDKALHGPVRVNLVAHQQMAVRAGCRSGSKPFRAASRRRRSAAALSAQGAP